MSSTQLSFGIRVSSGVKTVHLLGSWDNYVGQLPLSKDKSSSKSGSWKGTFKFQHSTLEPGQRYWYYYIVDGYHCAHNPSEHSTTEPTTGRELNILDVPTSSHKSSSSSSRHSSSKSSSSHKSSSKSSSGHHSSSKDKSSRGDHHHRSSHRGSLTVDIPKGRPLSVSQIKAPKPMSPRAPRHILNADYYETDDVDELTARFQMADMDSDGFITDFSDSPVSSLSSRSDSSGPDSSSLSGYSTPNSDFSSCTCERYGITRKGERVKLDCRGSRCGYSEDSSPCSSDTGSDVSSPEPRSRSGARRNGVVVGR